MRPDGARIVGLSLVGTGAIYFASGLGLLPSGAKVTALTALALLVLAYLTWKVEPAWILTVAIVSTMFAGNWQNVGLSSTIGPNRVLLVAGILAVILRAPPARNRPPLRFGRAHFAVAMALGYVAVSALFTGSLGSEPAQFELLDQFGVLPFALFVVAPAAFATRRQRNILLGGLVATGAYLSVTAVLEKLKLYSLLVPSYIGDPGVGGHFGRARGPFVEAAANGLALYTCAAAAAVAFVVWREPRARALAAAVAVLAPLGVLLTVTRGAWLAAVAGTLVAVVTTAGLRRFAPPIAVAGVIGVIAAFALIPGLAQDVQTRQNDQGPIWERRNTNAAGLRMVAERPFFGFGWWFEGHTLARYFRLQSDIPLVGADAGLHNIYIQYAASLGLVGVGLWVLALVLVFGRVLSARAPPELAPWQAGLKAVFVASLALGLFGPANYAFPPAVMWTWAGVLWLRETEPAVEPTRLRRPLVGARAERVPA